MSLAEFSSALRKRALENWVYKNPFGDTKTSAEMTKSSDKLNLKVSVTSTSVDEIQSTVDNITKDLDLNIDFLLNLKSSPSFLQLIEAELAATLSGKRIVNKFNRVKAQLTEIKAGELDQLFKSNYGKQHSITKLASKSVNPQIRDLKGRFYSLANLQVLLNTHLQDVISANMGKEPWPGGQRRILNYRTGRFASTVAVERLSQSRQGAITAFYSFMKNPYATFSKGGAQGHIPTRYPERLISKSIHEIAATMVGNRLRAVSI